MSVSADKKCCLPSCGKTRSDGTILHSFPDPDKDSERFRSWLYAIGGDILALDNKTIRKYCKVCHTHFEPQYYTSSKMLCINAIPTLHMRDKGILNEECKQTADIILFFDELFDSVNGNDPNLKKSGKLLLGPLTPNSPHHRVWREAKRVLNTMKYVTKQGKIGVVPSITNWLFTINNLQYLNDKLFREHNLKFIWQRHFNQDPLEIFFGGIRSHGARNTNPTCAGFEIAFAALLINNLSSNHSPGSNCEVDRCYNFKSLKNIFFNNNVNSNDAPSEIDFDDISDHILTGIENKLESPKIIAQIEYVAGFILSKTKQNICKKCKLCGKSLQNEKKDNYSIVMREYTTNKRCLTYPALRLMASFSDIQDVVTHILRKNCARVNIKNYIKTVLTCHCNFDYIECSKHKIDVIKYIQDTSANFFLYNWCKDINKLLNGRRTDYDPEDEMQKMAFIYNQKRRK